MEGVVCPSAPSGKSGSDCDTPTEAVLGEQLSEGHLLESAGVILHREETELV